MEERVKTKLVLYIMPDLEELFSEEAKALATLKYVKI